jgi:hypothetical protein
MKNLLLTALLTLVAFAGYADDDNDNNNKLRIIHAGVDGYGTTQPKGTVHVTKAIGRVYFTVDGDNSHGQSGHDNGNNNTLTFTWTATLNGLPVTSLNGNTGTIIQGVYAIDVIVNDNQPFKIGDNPLVVQIHNTTRKQNSNDEDDESGYNQNNKAEFNIKYDKPLPVELVSFSATASKGAAVLNWTTAMEVGFNYFVVQKSANGSDFVTVGAVKATGNRSNYRYEAPNEGGNYFRLKLVDNDASFTFSPVIFVTSERSIVSTELFDLNSRKLPADAPKQGFMVIVETTGAGVRTVRKVFYQ